MISRNKCNILECLAHVFIDENNERDLTCSNDFIDRPAWCVYKMPSKADGKGKEVLQWLPGSDNIVSIVYSEGMMLRSSSQLRARWYRLAWTCINWQNSCGHLGASLRWRRSRLKGSERSKSWPKASNSICIKSHLAKFGLDLFIVVVNTATFNVRRLPKLGALNWCIASRTHPRIDQEQRRGKNGFYRMQCV